MCIYCTLKSNHNSIIYIPILKQSNKCTYCTYVVIKMTNDFCTAFTATLISKDLIASTPEKFPISSGICVQFENLLRIEGTLYMRIYTYLYT